MYHVGVDIGGTKIAIAVFDSEFHCAAECVIPTDCRNGCRAMVEQIYRAYREMLSGAEVDENDVASIGVCSPGMLDLKTGTIVFISTMGFRNEPLTAYFEEYFKKPIVLQNDTNAAAIGEAIFGGGVGKSSIAYITVSTGIGCGIVIDGKIFSGSHFAAGELGHMKVKRGGRRCACGGRGCLESYASGTSIAAITRELTGKACQTRDVFDAARKREEPYRSIVCRAGDYLAFAISALYQILDPEVVILGGSVTRDWDVLSPILNKSISHYCEEVDGRTPTIIHSEMDGRQGIYGAAWLGKTAMEGETTV